MINSDTVGLGNERKWSRVTLRASSMLVKESDEGTKSSGPQLSVLVPVISIQCNNDGKYLNLQIDQKIMYIQRFFSCDRIPWACSCALKAKAGDWVKKRQRAKMTAGIWV